MTIIRDVSQRLAIRATDRAAAAKAPNGAVAAPANPDRFIRTTSALEGQVVSAQSMKAATALLMNVAAFATFGFGGLSGPRALRQPPLPTDNGRIERLIDGV